MTKPIIIITRAERLLVVLWRCVNDGPLDWLSVAHMLYSEAAFNHSDNRPVVAELYVDAAELALARAELLDQERHATTLH